MNDSDWHLDKKVPITLILAIVIQTAGGVWFLSGLSYQLAEVASHNMQQDDQIGALQATTQSQAISSATITQQISGVKDTLEQLRQDQREATTLLRQVLEKKP